MTEYRNFWIRIENRADGLYVASNSRAGGNVSAQLVLPEGLDSYNLGALLRAAGATRGAPDSGQRDLILTDPDAPAGVDGRQVGSELFHALLPGPVRDAFMRSAGDGAAHGVRIRLQIDPTDPELAELASLPWELIYNDVTRKALGRSKFTPVIRSLDVAQSYAMLPFTRPLRLLLVLANPSDTHPLNLDGEKTRVVGILEALDDVEVTVIEHATERKVYDALDTGQYHALHFMGHGGFSDRSGGVLLLEDERGRSAPLSAAELGDDLAERRAMRLVFLNACDTGRASHVAGADPFTGVAAALVAAGIPAVVAMQVPVADAAALAFAEKFYSMIANGEPVDAAVSVGRRAIWRADETSLEWATPVLFMRATDGYLFDPPRTRPEEEQSPVPAPATGQTIQPVVRAEPGKSGGHWAKTWGVAAMAIVGAVALALFVWGRLSNDVSEPDPGTPRFEVVSEIDVEDGVSEEAMALVMTSGVRSNADDFGQQRVAQDLVTRRPDGIPGEMEAIVYLDEAETKTYRLVLEQGIHYAISGICDTDCDGVILEIFGDSGDAFIGTVEDVVADDGPEPRLDIDPRVSGSYTLDVTLTKCSTPFCYVGVSVFAYDL